MLNPTLKQMFMLRSNFLGPGSKKPSYKSKMKQLSSIYIFLKIYIFDIKEEIFLPHYFLSICGLWWKGDIVFEICLFLGLQSSFLKRKSSYLKLIKKLN